MNKLFKTCLFILISLMISSTALSQVGREFWFVAPEVTSGHGEAPIFFRITTFDEPTEVTISSPANTSFNTLTVNIPANTQYTTPENAFDIDHIENRPSNTINNKGILITAKDADVSVYYEVASPLNPDKFTLKGTNSMGMEFFIPSQNIYHNQRNQNPLATEKVDIVASEDDTEVIIVPTADVVGYDAGDTIRVTLNRGQTFCVENRGQHYASSLAGTYVASNEPIAITISDDSINERMDYRGAYDLIGDQLIPTSVIGNEYVVVNTATLSNTITKVFVLATVDNTTIEVNGNPMLTQTLSRGEQTVLDITPDNMHIESNRPIYVYQLASLRYGGTNEMGSSLLPHVACTGSEVVSFKRIFSDNFFMQLLVKGKDRNNFSMANHLGQSLDYLDNINWIVVPGTGEGDLNEAWYSANIDLGAEIGTTDPYFVSNSTGLFHLSLLEENGSSASYGYFSSFSNLNVNGITEACQGNAIVLRTDEPMRSYAWYSDLTGNTVLSTTQEISVTQTATYWVTAEVQFGGCELTDSIEVHFVLPEIDLGGDTTVCAGTTLTFGGELNANTYNWSDGTSLNETSVDVVEDYNGELSVTVTDPSGCYNQDTVLIEAFPVPDIVLDVTTVCEGGVITNTTSFDRYEWEFGGVVLNIDQTQNYIVPQQTGNYTITGWTADGCSVTETINIVVNALPTFTLSDEIACDGLVHSVNAPIMGSGLSYLWSDGSTSASANLNAAGNYWLQITDGNACVASDTALFAYHMPIPIDLGPDRDECARTTLNISNSSDFSGFTWKFDDGTGMTTLTTPVPEYEYEITDARQDDSGHYVVEASDVNGCVVSDTVRIGFYDTNPPPLNLTRELCQGESIEIITSDGYDTYAWTHEGNSIAGTNNLTQITVDQPGNYVLTATYLTCIKTSNIVVDEHTLPTVQLPNDFNLCPGTEDSIKVQSFGSSGTSTNVFDYMYWNGDSNQRYDDWTSAKLMVNAAGTHTVSAVDEFGCVATDAITIGVHNTDPIPSQGPFTTCENVGQRLQNTHPSTRSYSWSRVESTGNTHLLDNADYIANQSGSYQLDIVDANGCIDSDTVVVNANPVPTVDLGPDVVTCEFDYLRVTPSTDYVTYRWNDDSSLNANELLVTSGGDYKLEVSNVYGCWGEDVVNVTVNAAPIFDLGADHSVCPGTSVELGNIAGNYSYLWSTGETTQNIQVIDGGKYELTITDVNGCSNTDSVRVNLYPVPKFSLGNDTLICPLDLSSEIVAVNENFPYYSWKNGESTSWIYAEAADSINRVIVRNDAGCYGFDTKLVTLMPTPEIELLPDTSICSVDTLSLEADPILEMWEWSDGSIDPLLEIYNAGEYWIRGDDGCFTYADTMQLVVNETPVIARLDTSIYAQVVLYPEGGTEPYKYAINDNEFQSENVFRNLENGEHVLYCEDDNGCLVAETVLFNNILDIDVPNFFTPNGDGFNDRWQIDGLERLPDSEIRIYDRFGKLLIKYLASEPAWDGTYLGKHVRSDDYWYVIELNPVQKILKGNLTLKR
ncbi:T9SS type B sorting domain-containing protein [Carboxylicivirga sp. N1Y90]|uniref:T9SS type B sorting domain-containing protein n=1 Tax=Carboxylicivirga fragile TaxID=3417571 RepID=UPI003D33ADD1|nr:T9SS type B sorting domain-containing protein [Marinilabiliaceae bacterium N1Y90]